MGLNIVSSFLPIDIRIPSIRRLNMIVDLVTGLVLPMFTLCRLSYGEAVARAEVAMQIFVLPVVAVAVGTLNAILIPLLLRMIMLT